jgi:hypothetical protein
MLMVSEIRVVWCTVGQKRISIYYVDEVAVEDVYLGEGAEATLRTVVHNRQD